jgi:hypothetical protein
MNGTQPFAHAGSTPGASAWWAQHSEASLNWLALGLLLAAWNVSDSAPQARRPEALRGYSSVSVRAATRTLAASERGSRS